MIYILHFEKKYFHAQHYVGYTKNPIRRFKEHFNGQQRSSPLLRAVLKAGIKIEVALLKSGTRKDERKIKNRKKVRELCPICIKQKGDKNEDKRYIKRN